jgi:acyl carrier protein
MEEDKKALLEQQVKKVIAETMRLEGTSALTPQTELVGTLGMDSLDMVELAMALEDEFDIDIDDDSISAKSTVKDVVELVYGKS